MNIMKMKKTTILILSLLTAILLYPIMTHAFVDRVKTEVVLEDGKSVDITLAACYNPVTKRLEPCFVHIDNTNK